jgi:hypothetical protein
MPHTSVENTSGAIIILIRRRNSVVISAMVIGKAGRTGQVVIGEVAGNDA